MSSATAVLEQLIDRMGDGSGPVERVIGQWNGDEVPLAAASALKGTPWLMATAVVEELGKSWGATGDPTWVDGLVPDRGSEDGPELDYMFALYRRPRIYAYPRRAATPVSRPQGCASFSASSENPRAMETKGGASQTTSPNKALKLTPVRRGAAA